MAGGRKVCEQLASGAGGAHPLDVEAREEPLVLPGLDQADGGNRSGQRRQVDRGRHRDRGDHGHDATVGQTVAGLVIEAPAVDPARQPHLHPIQRVAAQRGDEAHAAREVLAHVGEAVPHELRGRPARARQRERGEPAGRGAVDAHPIGIEQRA